MVEFQVWEIICYKVKNKKIKNKAIGVYLEKLVLRVSILRSGSELLDKLFDQTAVMLVEDVVVFTLEHVDG